MTSRRGGIFAALFAFPKKAKEVGKIAGKAPRRWKQFMDPEGNWLDTHSPR